MKKVSAFLACFTLISGISSFPAQAKNYYLKFNEKQSYINFQVISTLHEVHGQVKKFKGYISVDTNADETSITKADGLLEITTDSLFTNQGQRDSRMKGDILSVSKYPFIKFKVNRAVLATKPSSSGVMRVNLGGALTIRDVTKNVNIPVKVILSPDKSNTTVEGSYTVNFKEYNVPDPSIPLIGKVNEDINIDFNIKTY